MRLPYQFVIPTTSKSVKFLLACLIRKIIKGGIDPERPVWDLDQRGVEANYLKLLYNKKVDNSLINLLFTQTFYPFVVNDCRNFEHIFNCYRYGGYPFPSEGEKIYWLTLSDYFYKEALAYTQLDYLLGWPGDFAEIFFEYMETHPHTDNFSKLTKDLGFDAWGKASGKHHWVDSNNKIHYYKLDLERKPKRCPFCHSTELVDVIVGMPDFSELKGNEFFYGCCIDGLCPPPAWHCNHCGLFIWKTSDLFEDDL